MYMYPTRPIVTKFPSKQHSIVYGMLSSLRRDEGRLRAWCQGFQTLKNGSTLFKMASNFTASSTSVSIIRFRQELSKFIIILCWCFCVVCQYMYSVVVITNPITCMKLLASSIPGRESAKSVSSSFARPERPAKIKTINTS